MVQNSDASDSLQPIARGAILAGAVGSIGFLIRVGHGSPRFILTLIGIWVLAPFVAVSFVDAMSKRWPAVSRPILHAYMLVLAAASLVVYGAELVWPHKPAAFVFVALPPLSILLMAIVIAATARTSGNRPQSGHGA
jgi:hypothetical protein